MRSIAGLVVLLAVLPLAADAAVADADRCGAAIRAVEADASLPPGLLTAVAVSESGKYDPGRHAVTPWPWTVNNQGEGRYFATAADAIAHVQALQRTGQRSIDVGCMQINLMHHPDAFASLQEAFDPGHNVGYGAEFLRQLQDETQSWTRAVERYHTADLERGRAYREKVYARWQAARDDPVPEAAQPTGTMELAGLPMPAAAAPPTLRPLPDRRRLMPLATNGFLRLTDAPTRVAVLRPSPTSQLKPIVRMPRPPTGALVRLQPLRRALASSLP